MTAPDYVPVKYYGKNDMSIGFFLEKAEPIIENFDPAKEFIDVNEVIELYYIRKYIDSGLFLIKWDSQTVERYKDTCVKFDGCICKFYAKINNDNFISIYRSLNVVYLEDFWAQFEYYKVFTRVEGNILTELLSEGNTALWPILKYKNVVKYYDSELASFMRSSSCF